MSDSKTQDINKDFLTVNQAQEYLKCSRSFIYDKRKEGSIQAVTAGTRKVLIPKNNLDKFLKPETTK